MSRNFEPAFMGHPGVDPLTSARLSRTAAHANVMLPREMEYRIRFKDGTRSNWMPVSRGAMSMPPAAEIMEIRRKANGVVK